MPGNVKLSGIALVTSLWLPWGQASAADPDHRASASAPPASAPGRSIPAPSSASPADTPPCTSVALSETIGAGFNAFELKNEPAWVDAREILPAILACQKAPLSPELSARTLQFQGLAVGGVRQNDQMAAYLRGAATISHDYPFTDKMFDRGNSFARAWETAVAAPVPEPVALLSPDGLDLDRRVTTYVNGERTRQIIPDATSIVQVEVAPRGMLMTVPITPSAQDPRLPPVPALQDALDERARALKTRRLLLGVSGGAAVAALGSEVAGRGIRVDAGDGGPDKRAFVLHNVALGLTGASVGLFAMSWSVGR